MISSSLVRSLFREVMVTTSRSSGPGGQNVNKVETKIQLSFNIGASSQLSDSEKSILFKRFPSGVISVTEQGTRSQLRNKEIAFKKLKVLFEKAFIKPKARKATKPTRASQKKRLESKKIHSEKKKLRGRIKPQT